MQVKPAFHKGYSYLQNQVMIECTYCMSIGVQEVHISVFRVSFDSFKKWWIKWKLFVSVLKPRHDQTNVPYGVCWVSFVQNKFDAASTFIKIHYNPPWKKMLEIQTTEHFTILQMCNLLISLLSEQLVSEKV